MISFEMEDLIGVLTGLTPYFIAICAALVLALIVTIAVGKQKKPLRSLIRKEAWIAALLAIIVTVNMICFGPMSTLISLATGSGSVSEATTKEASDVALKIAEEGFVMLENENSMLPLESGKKLNLFGWASTNPIYGGAGSGGINDLYQIVSLEKGLTDAGFELNTELHDFYLGYAESRAAVSITAQNWNLPEPPAPNYTDELIANAKNFSDTAVIVISRLAGEGHSDIRSSSSTTAPTRSSSASPRSFRPSSRSYGPRARATSASQPWARSSPAP